MKKNIYVVCLILLFFAMSSLSLAADDQKTVVKDRKIEVIGKMYGYSQKDIQDTDEVGGTPVYIAQNSKGHLYIVYSGSKEEIQVFNEKGEFLFKFGQKGKNKNNFSSYICGIAINSKDEIYVCDVLRRKILVFNEKGKFLSSFSSTQGLTEEDKKQDTAPSHIAIDKEDKVYISDTANGHIWVHDASGKYLYPLGGPEQGRYPTTAHIRFDKQGRIYILEGLANRIQVCDPKGELLFTIGKTGSRVGKFLRISGVALDSKSKIYITDIVLSVIQVFDSEGNFLGVVKYIYDKGGKKELKGLSNIFIGQKDYIYLTELPFHRVTILKDNN